MHILSINVISFTAQIYNTLHVQGTKGRLWYLGGMALLPPFPNDPYQIAFHAIH